MTQSSQCKDAYGQSTDRSNDKRMMWYSTRCTYWTDNWSNLKTVGAGIPVCPYCQSPGYESTYNQFDKSARRYDTQVMDGYYTFLQEVKERCLGKPVSEAFNDWLHDGKRQIDRSIGKIIKDESNG